MKHKIKFLIVIILLGFISAQEPISKKALLLIDIQDFYFPGGKSELVNSGKAALQAADILEHFRASGYEVINIRHNFEPGGKIYKSVAPLQTEKVISKNEINSYNGTDLLPYLKMKGINKLVICGMMTHMCVEAAVRASYDYGFEVTLINDGCATKDLEYGKTVIKAADVHNSTLATLKNYSKIMTAKEFIRKENNGK